MAATSIFFNGRLISVPGSYSEVDASGLEAIGLSSTGVVALVGTSIGGKPWNAVDEGDVRGNLQVATNPQQPFRFFRSGDLREAAPLAFGPSNDADIPGGAQEIVFVKVNPATQSSASFSNTDGEALVLTSEDYGFHTSQINVEIANGSSKGKLITLVFEATTETFDDVGGDNIMTVQYLSGTPADGWTTVTAEVTASALVCAATRDQTGLDGEVSNQVTATQVIELNNAGTAEVQVKVYGTDTSDQTQSETVTVAGGATVDTVSTWNSFHGAEIVSGTLDGTLTIRNDGAVSTIATIAAAGTEAAIEFTVDTPVANSALTVVADAADTSRVTLIGLSTTGAAQTEVLQLNGTTPVAGTATWSRLDALALGELPAARTLSVSGNSVNAVFSGLNTVQKLADSVSNKPGFTLTSVVSNPSTYSSTDLDHLAATDCKSPATASMTGDLAAIISKLNSSSELVTAAKGSVASGAPDNTSSAIFLAGGNEGSSTPGNEAVITATSNDWQGALDLLKKIRVNTIVPLTGDPAVHAMVKTHCEYMGGVGRSERDAVVGLLNTGLTDVPTKTEAKSKIVDLGTRHVRAVAQAIERYDTAGTRVEMLPQFTACVVAGMQAGSPVGTSLTHKYANVLKLRQDSSWNPLDDSEELIQAGLCMLEVVDGVGRRVVRNVTTHLTDSNIAFTEASVNEAVNFSVFNFRSAMETLVGAQGFAGTVNAARGLAENQLGLLTGVALTTWRSLSIELVLDVLEVSVEISPVLPINFIKTTVHLVSVPQTA